MQIVITSSGGHKIEAGFNRWDLLILLRLRTRGQQCLRLRSFLENVDRVSKGGSAWGNAGAAAEADTKQASSSRRRVRSPARQR